MRIAAASALVLVLGSSASADRGAGASLDFGYVRSRVAVTDRTALDGDLARFGIRISSGRHFHFGAEVDDGQIEGNSKLPSGYVARSTEPPPPSTSINELEGNTLNLRAYAGLHSLVGRVMFGGDAVLGVRDTWVSSNGGPDIAGYKKEPALELRTRVEVFLSDTLTIGMVASTDVVERRNVSLALLLSFNFITR